MFDNNDSCLNKHLHVKTNNFINLVNHKQNKQRQETSSLIQKCAREMCKYWQYLQNYVSDYLNSLIHIILAGTFNRSSHPEVFCKKGVLENLGLQIY